MLAVGYLLMPASFIYAATPPPTCQILVKPTSINIGGSVTVKWTSTNATAGAITNIGNVGPNGSINLLPSSAAITTYFGAFTGPGGTTNCQASVAVSSANGGAGAAPVPTPEPVPVVTTLPSSQGSSGLVPCGYGKFTGNGNDHSSSTGCQACDLVTLVQNIMNFAIGIAIPIAAALFAYAGVLYFTSAANPANKNKATEIFRNAFIGFLIAITAWLIINTLLHVIFTGNSPFANGQWFTIICSNSDRPVNNRVVDVLAKLPILAGNAGAITSDGGPGGGSSAGGPGVSTIDAAQNALTANCAAGDKGSCSALDSISSNNNQLTDQVDEALSTSCDNGNQSSCNALLKITGNPDQTQGSVGASASSIAAAAAAYIGTDTSEGPGGGRVACAWAVNNILKNDGVAPLDGDSVAGMEQALQSRATYVNTSDAEAGDIIVWKSGSVSHVGICRNAGCSSALSNSSSNASFTNISGSTLMDVPGRVYHMNQ